MIERFARLHAPQPRPLTPTERLRLKAFELAWCAGWAVLGATFHGALGPFLCGLACCWSLGEVEKWVEAGRG